LTQPTLTGSPRVGKHPGIAMIAIVIAIVVVVTVATVAVYIVAASGTSTSSSGPTTTPTSSSTSFGVGDTSSTSPGPGYGYTTTSTTSTSTTASGLKTYSGTFNFTVPQGPFGELTFSNNDTVDTYTSVQVASGSFNFTLNPNTYIGSGSGRGTITETTTGFCSGRVTVPYTFQIPDATNILGGNITIFIGTPSPANVTATLTCRATPNAGSATGNTTPFLAVYPNEISVASIPTTVSENLSGGISYHFTITPTN